MRAPSPLRVTMIGKGWFPAQVGGLDRFFTDLARELQIARGVDVQPVVVGPADEPSVTAVADHDAPLLRRLWDVNRACRRSHADVVDAHFALYAAVPVLLGGLRRARVVVHFHGPWADESVAAGDASSTRAVLRRALERAVYRRASCIVVLTGAFRRVLLERYRVSPWVVAVEPPGVDLQRFAQGEPAEARRRLGIPDSAFVACAVRRLVPRMGLDLLLEAWALLDPVDECESMLVVAGDGPLRPALEARARELGIADRVRFLGRLTDDDLVAVYQAANVNVVPTVALEGFGLIVLEAAACGTPSIVTGVGGLPEAIRRLDDSLVVRPRAPVELAERIRLARDDGMLPTRESTRAFAESHDWAGVARRTILRFGEEADRRRRVVFLVDSPGGEAARTQLADLLLSCSQFRTHVILTEEGPLADDLAQRGVSVESLLLVPSVRSGRASGWERFRAELKLVWNRIRLVRRLRQLEADVIDVSWRRDGSESSLQSADVTSVAQGRSSHIGAGVLGSRIVRRYLGAVVVDGSSASGPCGSRPGPDGRDGELPWPTRATHASPLEKSSVE